MRISFAEANLASRQLGSQSRFEGILLVVEYMALFTLHQMQAPFPNTISCCSESNFGCYITLTDPTSPCSSHPFRQTFSRNPHIQRAQLFSHVLVDSGSRIPPPPQWQTNFAKNKNSKPCKSATLAPAPPTPAPRNSTRTSLATRYHLTLDTHLSLRTCPLV